jgi:hypothetical protein
VPLRTALLLPALALLGTGCSFGHATTDADASPPSSSAGIVAVAASVETAAADAGTASADAGTASADAGTADSSDAGAPVEDGPRIGSIGRTTWIYVSRARKERLGYVRPGTSVRLLGLPPVDPPLKKRQKSLPPLGQCKSGRWYAVQPKGFVCGDETTTLDLALPLFRALAFAGPRPGAVPFGYAFSTRAPMYGKLPTPAEEKRAERRLTRVSELVRLRRSTAGHEDLAFLDPPAVTDPLPDFLADNHAAPVPARQREGLVRKEIPHGSMLSFQQVFAFAGRTFLLTPDLTVVPADRMRLFHPSTFHGTPIDEAHPLPIGWFRRDARAKFRRGDGGALADTGETWAPRTFVGLTGTKVVQRGVVYRETRDDGLFARDGDLSIVETPKALPRGAEPGEKWIEVSLSKGTLTLFEGTTGVYSTLMSPGAGGTTPSAAMHVDELLRAALTPLGSFRVAIKHRAAQMTSEASPEPDKFWIADVPHAQYFRTPYAIHAAYWHEDFGSPKSGGCVNLSLEDAARVFDWTEPVVPEGWGGIIARRSKPGTLIVIHR